MRRPRKIKADRELQARIGTGKIDEKKVEEAQKVIDEDETDFVLLARPDLELLQTAVSEAKKDISDGVAVMASLKKPIMNLKANAGSFKYEFVSQLTSMVLLLFEAVDKPDKKVVQIADVLHKTILLALAYQMKGDGGKNGKILVETFHQLCEKYKAGLTA